MPSEKPQFVIGDRVRERFPTNTRRESAVVIDRYELNDQYRYVVRFDNGSERVFFERELVSIAAAK